VTDPIRRHSRNVKSAKRFKICPSLLQPTEPMEMNSADTKVQQLPDKIQGLTMRSVT